VTFDRALNECPCQASIVRYSTAGRESRSCIVFANPDNVGEKEGEERGRDTPDENLMALIDVARTYRKY
jgi:hypothetical protein